MPENEKPLVIPDDPEQSKRFEDAARLLGADETDGAFKRAVQTVIPAKSPVAPLVQSPQQKSRA